MARIRSTADAIRDRLVLRSQYRTVFGTSDNRTEAQTAVLTDIAKAAGQFDDRTAQTDREVFLNLGERRLFLKIMKMLRYAPEEIEALAEAGRDHE